MLLIVIEVEGKVTRKIDPELFYTEKINCKYNNEKCGSWLDWFEGRSFEQNQRPVIPYICKKYTTTVDESDIFWRIRENITELHRDREIVCRWWYE